MTATVLLTISCPAIGLIVGYYCLTERYFDWKSGVMCIALFMSAIAYSYHPTEPSDIVRYIEYAQNISKLSLPEALHHWSAIARAGAWAWGFAPRRRFSRSASRLAIWGILQMASVPYAPPRKGASPFSPRSDGLDSILKEHDDRLPLRTCDIHSEISTSQQYFEVIGLKDL